MSHAPLLAQLGVSRPTEFDELPDHLVWSTVLAWQSDPSRRGTGLLVWMLRRAKPTSAAPTEARMEDLVARANKLAAELIEDGMLTEHADLALRLFQRGHLKGVVHMEQIAAQWLAEATGQLSIEQSKLRAA
jgi:hypothetical protein